MRTFVYMNEAIREKVPSKPVIVVQRGRRTRNTNRAKLVVDGKVIGRIRFSRSGFKKARGHHVRAWVELNDTVSVKI